MELQVSSTPVFGRNAQIAVTRRGPSERVKSTRRGETTLVASSTPVPRHRVAERPHRTLRGIVPSASCIEFRVGIHLGNGRRRSRRRRRQHQRRLSCGTASTTLASGLGRHHAIEMGSPLCAKGLHIRPPSALAPPVIASIAISSNLPRCGVSPSGSTISTINSRSAWLHSGCDN